MARRVLIPVLVLVLFAIPAFSGGWTLTIVHKINAHPSVQERSWREMFCYHYVKTKTYNYDFWVKELEGADVVVTPVPPTSSGGAVATSNAIVIGNGTVRWVDVYVVLPRSMTSEPVYRVVVEIVDKTHDVTCWNPETGNASESIERIVTEYAKVDNVDLGAHTLYWKPHWEPGEPFYFKGSLYIAVAAPLGAHIEDPVVPAPEPQPSPPLPPGGNTTATPVPPTTSNSTRATATTAHTATPGGDARSVHHNVSPALLGLGAIAALFLLLARR